MMYEEKHIVHKALGKKLQKNNDSKVEEEEEIKVIKANIRILILILI
jgi:hypothetical protein